MTKAIPTNGDSVAMRLTGKPQLNRFINRRLILQKLREAESISRADLAKQTGIRPPTVSAVVKEMIEEGLIRELGAGAGGIGRIPQMVGLATGQGCALGFELTEHSARGALCDVAGNVCGEREFAMGPSSPEEAVAALQRMGDELLGTQGIVWQSLRGIGVALPGHLNADSGIVRWSRPLNWRDVRLKTLCETTWSVATDVVNNSMAGAMASHLFDSEDAVKNLVFLNLRFQVVETHGVVGVGTGIIINGAPYYGEFGAAGETTTPIVHPLVRMAELTGRQHLELSEFVDAFAADDPAALAAMETVAGELCTLAIGTVNLLEPGALLVGSDVPELCEPLLERMRRYVDQLSLPHRAGKTLIAASRLGDFGVARGAIVPTLQRLFQIPQWH
jgi:N-acetylglucosamine repressor